MTRLETAIEQRAEKIKQCIAEGGTEDVKVVWGPNRDLYPAARLTA